MRDSVRKFSFVAHPGIVCKQETDHQTVNSSLYQKTWFNCNGVTPSGRQLQVDRQNWRFSTNISLYLGNDRPKDGEIVTTER